MVIGGAFVVGTAAADLLGLCIATMMLQKVEVAELSKSRLLNRILSLFW